MSDVSADPRQMTPDQLLKVCYETFSAADPWSRVDYSGARWVMSRLWYDCIRAAACSPEQELALARAHADLMIQVNAPLPIKCPVCQRGPFADLGALSEHVIAMSDPQNREPHPGDYMFGVPIEVREDGGMPHLEPLAESQQPR